MHYRCEACGTRSRRGFLPGPDSSYRWAIFHGIALGTCGTATKLLFLHFGYTTDGWQNGLASLGICAVFMFVFYAVAIMTEAFLVAVRQCPACGERGLRVE